MSDDSFSSDPDDDEPMPPRAPTGFTLALSAVVRDEVDDSKPVALPWTPREVVMQSLPPTVPAPASVGRVASTPSAATDIHSKKPWILSRALSSTRALLRGTRAKRAATRHQQAQGDEAAHSSAAAQSDAAKVMSGRSASASMADDEKYRWLIRMADVEMRARLGAGAFGEVWSGRWRRSDVAVKLLHGHLCASA
jgi:hypothetical protein